MSSASLNSDGPLQSPQNRGAAQPDRAEAHPEPNPRRINVANYPVLLRLLAPAEQYRPRQLVNFTGDEFPALAEASKQGKYPVLRYPIPGGTLCYTFEHLRTTTQGRVVYRCTGCRKKEGKTISVVNGTHLVGDPTRLPHVCKPWKDAKDRVNRMFYKKCQDIPNDSRMANVRPIQVFQEMAHQVFSSDVASEAERNDMLSYLSDDGYKHRRNALWRATSKLRAASA